MRFLVLYVDGGKGHYVPAKAVTEQLEAMGHEVVMENFFTFMKLDTMGKINKKAWKTMLKHTGFENKFSKGTDQDTGKITGFAKLVNIIRKKRFRKKINSFRPDMVFTTHPYPEIVVSEMMKWNGFDIPVSYYATDVFSVPVSTISDKISRFYVSTEEGVESARSQGQPAGSLRLCPFPLQANLKDSPVLSKAEARKRLGLAEDVFTLQLNFGGEGVGSFALLKALKDIGRKMQVVVLGAFDDRTRARLQQIADDMPAEVDVRVVGFVSNVNEYLAACDVIAGRAGINTIVEAFFLRRPFLITELVYTVMASADYVVSHKVGWNANGDVEKQVEALKSCVDGPKVLEDFNRNFDALPITYDAKGLAEMLVEDTIALRVESK